jgi:elongation factor Tu
MMMPGDSAEVSVVLCHAIAMKELSRFFIREGNRTIGYGVVTRTEAEARTSA